MVTIAADLINRCLKRPRFQLDEYRGVEEWENSEEEIWLYPATHSGRHLIRSDGDRIRKPRAVEPGGMLS